MKVGIQLLVIWGSCTDTNLPLGHTPSSALKKKVHFCKAACDDKLYNRREQGVTACVSPPALLPLDMSVSVYLPANNLLKITSKLILN